MILSVEHVAFVLPISIYLHNYYNMIFYFFLTLKHRSVQKSVISVLMPIVLLILSVPVWAIIFAYYRYKGKITETPGHYFKYRLTVTEIAIIFFTYPNVTNQLLSFFTCNMVSHWSCELNLLLGFMDSSNLPKGLLLLYCYIVYRNSYAFC